MKPVREENVEEECRHFQKLLRMNSPSSEFSFVKPQVKGWICLYVLMIS